MSTHTRTAQLNSLFKEWEKEYRISNSKFMRDGIINEDLWNNAATQILFVLKEPNGSYYSRLSDDKKSKYKYDLRKMSNDVPWKEIGCFSYGLQNVTESDFPSYEEAGENYEKACRQSAIINLKKLPGEGSAKEEEIEKFANEDKKKIAQEIEIIFPKVIVLGGVGEIFRKVFDGFLKKGERIYKFKFSENGNCFLTVDFVHPQTRVAKDIPYYALMALFQRYLMAHSI